MMLVFTAAIIISVWILIAIDQSDTESMSQSVPIPEQSSIVNANNQFAMNFYSHNDRNDNIFFSPWRISIDLPYCRKAQEAADRDYNDTLTSESIEGNRYRYKLY